MKYVIIFLKALKKADISAETYVDLINTMVEAFGTFFFILNHFVLFLENVVL